jgi:hypothetical protein
VDMAAPSAPTFVRVLLALPDVGQRTAWARAELAGLDRADAARLLELISHHSSLSDPSAREAMVVVVGVIAGLGDCEWVVELRQAAQTLGLAALARLLGPELPVARDEPEPETLPVPDYGQGRELTLGERRSLARRPTRAAFDRLLGDPHPLVIRQLLENPKLTEDDVVRLATRRPAQATTLRELANSPKWLCRGRVRMSILLNPGSSPALTYPLLGVCSSTELREVTRSMHVSPELRQTAAQYLELRRKG